MGAWNVWGVANGVAGLQLGSGRWGALRRKEGLTSGKPPLHSRMFGEWPIARRESLFRLKLIVSGGVGSWCLGFMALRVTLPEVHSQGSEFQPFSGSSSLDQTAAVSRSLSLSFSSNQSLE